MTAPNTPLSPPDPLNINNDRDYNLDMCEVVQMVDRMWRIERALRWYLSPDNERDKMSYEFEDNTEQHAIESILEEFDQHLEDRP